MMVRNPIDRIISEYYFLRDRKNFIDLFQSKPKSLEEYILNKQTHNGVINFLKGRRIYSTIKASETDYNDVINSINQIPIKVGLFEDYEKSTLWIAESFNISLNSKIEVKRATLNRPKTDEINEELKDKIKTLNFLDWKLYHYCKEKFQNEFLNIENKKIEFINDEYNHIIPYAKGMCLFEFCVQNKKFINGNLLYFKNLTLFLLDVKRIVNGKDFIYFWNRAFYNALIKSESNYFLSKEINSILDRNLNQMTELLEIAKVIDSLPFDSLTKIQLSFDSKDVESIQFKKSFLSKFFQLR